MAEFLVKAADAAHADPVKDARGCYKRGDMVVVMPDGHPWGREEGLPKFVVVKIPGLDAGVARRFVESEIDANGEVTRRRLWGLLVDSMPTTTKNQFLSAGSVTVTLAQVRGHIKNKLTGETA
jgi:hypothetical protein